MLKLMKYEYRKNLVYYSILFISFLILFCYCMIAIQFLSNGNKAVSVGLFIFGSFAGIIYLIILNIQTFAKEMNSKESYMPFMTPNSAYKIIGAKLLSGLTSSIVFTAIYGLMSFIIYQFTKMRYPSLDGMEKTLNLMFQSDNPSVSFVQGTLMKVIIIALNVWVVILFIACVSYFSITLSKTFLAEMKFRGFLSVAIFIAIMAAYAYIQARMPELRFSNGLVGYLINKLPTAIFDIVVMIATYMGTATLLEKRVSL